MALVQLRGILRGLPDLAKGLCRMQYGKVCPLRPQTSDVFNRDYWQCSPKELAVLITSFNKVASAFPGKDTPESVGLKSPLLCNIICALPKLKEPAQFMLDAVSLKKASENNKEELWLDPERYPKIADADMVRLNYHYT